MMPDAIPLRLACLAILLLITPEAGSQDAKPAPAEKSEAVVETAGSQLTSFGRQIPAQRPNRGIWIPSFSDGLLSSVVEADVVTRIDDQRLFAENMTIHLHGAEEKDQVKVDMPTATYHMTSQMIRSNERSKVSRADFDLEGDSLIFDTTTSQGRMTGNVRMTIHDAKGFIKGAPVPADKMPADTAPPKTPPDRADAAVTTPQPPAPNQP